MPQQINLYRYVKRPVKSPVDTRVFLITLSLFFGILMTGYFTSLIYQYNLSLQTSELEKKLAIVRQQLADVIAKYPHSQFSEEMIKLPPCDIRFSRYLQAFAKALVPGIWLTEIEIANGGESMSLHGRALKATEVQNYLDKLKQQPVFSNLNFEIADLSSISESTTNPSVTTEIINFHLTTTGAVKHV